MKEKRETPQAFYEGLLLVTTIAWSLSFIWSKVATNAGLTPELYLFFRYTLAALLLLPFAGKKLRYITKAELKTGFIMGCIFYAGMIFQTAGLAMTTPSNSSFITTSYVVLVPFAAWVMMKKKPDKITYAAVLIAMAGIYILNMSPGETIAFNLGNVLTLIGAVWWAVQVPYTSIAGGRVEPLKLSFMTFAFTGLGGLIMSLVKGTLFAVTGTQIRGAALAVLLSALFPTILGNLVQVYAQPKVDPSKAAVIYTMEGVLATIISIIMGMEKWSISVLAGGALILAAVLVIQFGGKKNAGQ